MLRLNPGHHPAMAQRALSLAALGRLDQAQAALPPAGSLLGDIDGGARGLVLARAGNRRGAEAELARMAEERGSRYVEPQAEALVHTALGDHDGAFAALERAMAARGQSFPLITVYPELAPLRSDPRFRRLVGAMVLGP